MTIKFNLITFSNNQKIGSTLQFIFATLQPLDVFQAINYKKPTISNKLSISFRVCWCKLKFTTAPFKLLIVIISKKNIFFLVLVFLSL